MASQQTKQFLSMKLREQLRSAAQEYARQVGELIGYRPEYWVADDTCIDVCCFGETYFLDLSDMQIIIDHMDEWLRIYHRKSHVARAVMQWMDWSISDLCDDDGLWRSCPRINLWSWLKGMRPEDIRWGTEDDCQLLGNQLKVLRRLAKSYPTSTVENVIKQLNASLDCLNEQLAKAAREAIDRYNDLKKDEHEKEH